MLLMGLATAHLCIEATHGEERRTEAVVLRAPYVFGTHEDRAAELAVDLDIFARQVVAAATTSGDAPPGNSFRQQQEIAARWWNRNQNDVWHAHAQRVQLFNQSGMDSTLPTVPDTDKETA